MRQTDSGKLSSRIILAVFTLLVTYFSVVSTYTNARVSSIENKCADSDERIVVTERNIAVILEKIENIEALVALIREDLRSRRSNGIDVYGNAIMAADAQSKQTTQKTELHNIEVTYGNSQSDNH